jgi:hypothetical protein
VEGVAKQAGDMRAQLPTGGSGGWVSRVASSAYLEDARRALNTDVRELLSHVGASETIRQVGIEIAVRGMGATVGAAFETESTRKAAEKVAEKTTGAVAGAVEEARDPALRPAASAPKFVHNTSDFLRGKIRSSNGTIPRGAWAFANNRIVELTDPRVAPIKAASAVPKIGLYLAGAMTPVGWGAIAAIGVAMKVGEWVLVKGATRAVELR